MKNENGYDETLNHQDTEIDTELDLDIDIEDEVDYKSKAEKAEELANNYKIRAEKAESKLKYGTKPEVKSTTELSTLDIIAITKSNIDAEDIDTVTKFAKSWDMTIQEAIQSDELKAILSVKTEKRNVQQASHTGVSRRSSNKMTDDVLLANASKGILPDSDEDFERLSELRLKRK